MPQELEITAEEKGIIFVLSVAGTSQSIIAPYVRSSCKTVYNILQHREAREARERSEKLSKATDAVFRKLYRLASDFILTARYMRSQLQLPFILSHFQHLLQTTPLLKHQNLKLQLSLTEQHHQDSIK